MVNSLTVLKFSKENEAEFRKCSKRIPKEFYILSRYKFDNAVSIFLLTAKGLLHTQKVIGYSIVIDFSKLENDKANLHSLVYKLDSELIINPNNIYIEDFVIAKYMRRRGVGTEFLNIIKNDYYMGKELVLKPDGDGKKFWGKVGFEYKKDYEGVMTMNCK